VFGSFGWSGEAVDEMEAKLKDGGYGFAFKPIKVKFKPTATVRLEHGGMMLLHRVLNCVCAGVWRCAVWVWHCLIRLLLHVAMAAQPTHMLVLWVACVRSPAAASCAARSVCV
jgi:hypothetical protein